MAEDDEDDRDAIRDAFARNRMIIDLSFVKDGEELLDFLRRRGPHVSAPRPKLILLDLNLPRKDGREALREIKMDPLLRSIPIVVLTTSSQEEEILRSYDLGANSFITKPVTFDELVRVIGLVGVYWFQLVDLPPHARQSQHP
jgi:CheY-like chemotaxis protein